MPVTQQRSHFSVPIPCDLAIKILNRMPAEHRRSFTSQQIVALEHALRERQSKPYIKLSLGPCYLSLLAGRHRQGASKRSKGMLVPALCLIVSVVGIGCINGLIKFRSSYQNAHAIIGLQSQEQRVHPTVLPFRKSQSNCEKNKAIWIDGECVDPNYNLTF